MLNSFTIILVEPQSPGNIGMVCRAMKNMGLSSLRLVKGCDHLHQEAYKFAVSAKDLLEKAEVFPSLDAALADINISVATTRRTGKYRQELLTPPQLADLLHQQQPTGVKAALVFGREDSGLTTDELSRCTLQATIPSSDECGSLNLAQSVLLFGYEMFTRQNSSQQEENQRQPAPAGDLEPLFAHMQQTLSSIGFLNAQNPEHIMRTMRRIIFRSGLDSREIAVLRGMFSQVDWACSGFVGRKGQKALTEL